MKCIVLFLIITSSLLCLGCIAIVFACALFFPQSFALSPSDWAALFLASCISAALATCCMEVAMKRRLWVWKEDGRLLEQDVKKTPPFPLSE